MRLIWRADPWSRPRQSSGDAIRQFKTKLKSRRLGSVVIRYAPRRKGEGGHFHDRRVIADVSKAAKESDSVGT